MHPSDLTDQLERASSLDSYAERLTSAVRRVIPPGPVRDVLHGVPIGHPTHPVLVQLPVGAFASAGILDLTPRTGPAAPILIGVGLAASVPAAAAGLTDWSEQRKPQQRVGLVHAGCNVLALGLYTASLWSRLRGRRTQGKILAYAGLTAVGAGGFLGGHLAYAQASGANHAEAAPHLVPPGWHDLCALDDLPEGVLERRAIEDVRLLVLRRGAGVSVLGERCSHLDGPLSEGTLTRDNDGQECITCPWHGSTFRLADGSVFRGPATAPQQAFEVRIDDGRVLVRVPD